MSSKVSLESALHEKAWGKQWPQHTGAVLRTDVVPASPPVDDDAMDLDQDDMPVSVVDDVYGGGTADIPERFDYVCLEGMRQVAKALGSTTRMQDVLIVRHEYVMLLDAMAKIPMEDQTIGLVVTGQPGIGKTAFLLYLLLHRMEHELPTAVQFNSRVYIIFDEEGARTVALADPDDRLAKCWALADSNANVTQPCDLFRSAPQMVIQASSLKAERWREWLKQLSGTCVISDLPDILEIAAILKELQCEPSLTFSLVNKWGPSIRTILDIVLKSNRQATERRLALPVRQAAKNICANPSSISPTSEPDMATSEGSSLVFIRPFRPEGFTDIESSQLCTFFIPTNYLNDIFETSRLELSNAASLQLFCAFSSHSLTRSAGGWGHEVTMHRRLCRGGEALSISRGDFAHGHWMRPSTNLLSGTAAGLKSAVLSTPFYWMPSVINFPGVDGVLGDIDGNIYVVQATIADEHSSPVEGLRLIWGMVGRDLRDRGVWHFVVVANAKSTADRLVARFSDELKDVSFGRRQIRMAVWGCVLSR